MKCPFSCLHIYHFLFLTTPEMMDSTSFFQNCQALSHLKSFGPDFFFSCKVLITLVKPLVPATYTSLPKHTFVCPHVHMHALDLFQTFFATYIKYHKSFISATILIPCPLSSQNLSLYLIFFNTCTCIYLFYVWLLYDQRKQKTSSFVFHIMTNNEARSLQMTHSLYEYIYKNYNIYSLAER